MKWLLVMWMMSGLAPLAEHETKPSCMDAMGEAIVAIRDAGAVAAFFCVPLKDVDRST